MAVMEDYIYTALSEDFLNEKVNRAVDYIRETGKNVFEPALDYLYYPTCVFKTRSGYVFGDIFNIRDEFTNHIQFIINPDTFEYSVKQIDFYNGITVWSDCPGSVLPLSELTAGQRVMLEGIIARTLRKCSQYAIDDDWFIRVCDGFIMDDELKTIEQI